MENSFHYQRFRSATGTEFLSGGIRAARSLEMETRNNFIWKYTQPRNKTYNATFWSMFRSEFLACIAELKEEWRAIKVWRAPTSHKLPYYEEARSIFTKQCLYLRNKYDDHQPVKSVHVDSVIDFDYRTLTIDEMLHLVRIQTMPYWPFGATGFEVWRYQKSDVEVTSNLPFSSTTHSMGSFNGEGVMLSKMDEQPTTQICPQPFEKTQQELAESKASNVEFLKELKNLEDGEVAIVENKSAEFSSPSQHSFEKPQPLEDLQSFRDPKSFKETYSCSKSSVFGEPYMLNMSGSFKKTRAFNMFEATKDRLFEENLPIKSEPSFKAILKGHGVKERFRSEGFYSVMIGHFKRRRIKEQQPAKAHEISNDENPHDDLEDKVFLWGPGPDEFSHMSIQNSFIHRRIFSEGLIKVSARRPVSATSLFWAVLTNSDVLLHNFSYGHLLPTKSIGEDSQLNKESNGTKYAIRKLLEQCQHRSEKQTQQQCGYTTEDGRKDEFQAGTERGPYGMILYFINDYYDDIKVLEKYGKFVHKEHAYFLCINKIHCIRTIGLHMHSLLSYNESRINAPLGTRPDLNEDLLKAHAHA